jgi:hypothetical protein
MQHTAKHEPAHAGNRRRVPVGNRRYSQSGSKSTTVAPPIPVLGDKAKPGITANSRSGGRRRLGRHGRIRHTCRSVGDGERGFVYVTDNTATLHKILIAAALRRE